jgi:hypothetical protein
MRQKPTSQDRFDTAFVADVAFTGRRGARSGSQIVHWHAGGDENYQTINKPDAVESRTESSNSFSRRGEDRHEKQKHRDLSNLVSITFCRYWDPISPRRRRSA